MKYKCLSIAGFDGSGGAGIQADLKTFSALGCYGMTVLTALPVQNTRGVRNCYDISLKCIQEQLEAIFDDIVPDSIKIGMLFSSPLIKIVADFLLENAPNIPIVLDPVMVAKSGESLLLPEAIETLKTHLIPLATIITPNLPEAYSLVGNMASPDVLATQLLKLGSHAVLLKGGHGEGNTSEDVFLDSNNNYCLLKSERIISKNTHGTGCTLSAAICSFLALENSLLESCKLSKDYLLKAIIASKVNSVGNGHGPVHHFHKWWT